MDGEQTGQQGIQAAPNSGLKLHHSSGEKGNISETQGQTDPGISNPVAIRRWMRERMKNEQQTRNSKQAAPTL